jgi:phosphopantothenoylcysteine decarboxylase/phosphopantothenate--cysteine ligase
VATLTIRNIDESVKQALRERAARNGRSMEEEMRLLLSALDAGRATPSPVPAQAVPARAVPQPVPSPAGHQSLAGKRILLIISGGIAAYKSLDLIRRLRERGAEVRPVMTAGAQEFVTPLAVGALAADHVYTDLFSREDEQDVGHIRLARDCDLICVAPATADLMAKMANGLAGDLASTVLLATNKPVLIAPAMNPAMWSHPATRRNVETLRKDGIRLVGPMAGEMAESNEAGEGRMAEPLADRGQHRGAAWTTRRSRSTAGPPSSPRARRMSRSTRCATSPTARPASRATPSPPISPALAPR